MQKARKHAAIDAYDATSEHMREYSPIPQHAKRQSKPLSRPSRKTSEIA